MQKIDSEWFQNKIRNSKLRSQRQFAKRMKGRDNRPLDPASLHYMIMGKRSMQIHEAHQLSELLEVPMTEILKRAGLDLSHTKGKCAFCGQ